MIACRRLLLYLLIAATFAVTEAVADGISAESLRPLIGKEVDLTTELTLNASGGESPPSYLTAPFPGAKTYTVRLEAVGSKVIDISFPLRSDPRGRPRYFLIVRRSDIMKIKRSSVYDILFSPQVSAP